MFNTDYAVFFFVKKSIRVTFGVQKIFEPET